MYAWRPYIVGCLDIRKNNVNTHIVLPSNSSFCHVILKSWQLLQPIAKVVKISYQARFCFQISYPAILLTMLIGFLNCGRFYRSRHSAGAHNNICMFNENQKGNNCTSWEPWGCLNIFRVCPICPIMPFYLQGSPVLGLNGGVLDRRRSSEPSNHPIFGQIFDAMRFSIISIHGHSVQHIVKFSVPNLV